MFCLCVRKMFLRKDLQCFGSGKWTLVLVFPAAQRQGYEKLPVVGAFILSETLI